MKPDTTYITTDPTIDLEAVCRDVHAQTQAFHARVASRLGHRDHGFRVLYGPPFPEAPVLFLGFQPGGGKEDMSSDHHAGWPERCEYAHETWLLAKRMRAIWGADFLDRCTGLNLIFFRARNIRAWKALEANLRNEIECFCRAQVERVVEAIAPKRIVVIGIGTFDRLKVENVELFKKGRTLAKVGKIYGRPAPGVIHLSGAHLSGADFDHLKDLFSRSA
jgi:hypothetical protein